VGAIEDELRDWRLYDHDSDHGAADH
jgi:hypothetical protein